MQLHWKSFPAFTITVDKQCVGEGTAYFLFPSLHFLYVLLQMCRTVEAQNQNLKSDTFQKKQWGFRSKRVLPIRGLGPLNLVPSLVY